jgi:hypothetical protein
MAGLLYLFFQFFLFNQLTLFRVAVPFVFLLFLFTLPFTLPTPALYLIAFMTGLVMDLFGETETVGLHAFSCLLAISLRGTVAELVTSSSYRGRAEISFRNQPLIWYVSILAPLILVHHLFYFFLEAFTFSGFFFTLLKVIASGLYTFAFCFIFSYLFYMR